LDSGPGQDYQALKKWALDLQLFGIKLGLSSTEALLGRLGNPEKGLKFIHLAGTNGKGSTAAMVATALKEAGLKVGFYSSPHLVSFRERFLINGRMPLKEHLAPYMARVREVADEIEPPTFFEFTTALALLFFAQEGVDLAVMETGLGGRLDATNIIRPLASLITNISLEHTQYLGSTIEEIAAEKAGIIKPHTPVATQELDPRAAGVVETRAREVEAPLFRLGQEFKVIDRGTGFDYQGLAWNLEGLKTGPGGDFQKLNAGLALAGLELLGRSELKVGPEAARRGLAQAAWPGRFQIVGRRPLTILDGAHNPQACQTLAQALQTIPRERLILVLGLMSDKDHRAVLKTLGPLADLLILTRPAYERSAQPRDLASQAREIGLRPVVEPELGPALDRAKASAGEDDLVLITGSLFLAGEVMELLGLDPFPEGIR
jgi:dihydrofolate synthase/folylpolyglutamate synthase